MVAPEAAKVLMQGLMISKLDYCNALLLGVSDRQLNKHQKIQNMGCHVIDNLGKYDQVTDSMKDLHWLKMPEHSQFKTLITVYQCVNDLAPSFVKDLLNLDLSKKSFRSETQGKLPIPWFRMLQVRDSSIRYAGPRPWNALLECTRNAETFNFIQIKAYDLSFCKNLVF